MFTTDGGARFSAVIDLKAPNFAEGAAAILSATGGGGDRKGPAARFAYYLANNDVRAHNNADGGDVFILSVGESDVFMLAPTKNIARAAFNAAANRAVVHAFQGVDLTLDNTVLTSILTSFINAPTYTIAAGSVATVAIVAGQVELHAEIWKP